MALILEDPTNNNTTVSYNKIEHPKLLHYAKHNLSKEGVLKQTEGQSYFYLKVEDDYILKLFPMIEIENIGLPDYFSPLNPTGAHISVIYPDEVRENRPDEEVGQSFNFEITGFFSLQTINKKYYALTVSSANLLALRHKYHLGELLNYRGLLVPFHITIAVFFSMETTNAHC